jgi:hypothetical protein
MRFEPRPEDGGVLDRTTGLVWERAPERASLTWVEATAGSDDGWRLPTIGELSDLAAGLVLGHPFEPADPEGVFWSSSESPFTRQHDLRGIAFEGGGQFAVVLLERISRARRWRVRAVPNGRSL